VRSGQAVTGPQLAAAPTPPRPAPPIWMDLAACADAYPEVFFPDPARIDLVNAAKRICAACPVTDD
jgi:hypothetical protein